MIILSLANSADILIVLPHEVIFVALHFQSINEMDGRTRIAYVEGTDAFAAMAAQGRN